ncbi:flagellar biosynthetic protein FliO [bacterium]|nr:flagellar biosynthetic protein FliO [bacterium]MCP5463117.1 flagellar biosynthetic protein FliO [bacterium]
MLLGIRRFFFCLVFYYCTINSLPIEAQETVDNNLYSPQEKQTTEGFLEYEEPHTMQEPDFKRLLVRIIVSLSVIISCIILVSWLLKIIFQDKASAMQKKERCFEVVDRLYLDNKKVIYLIKLLDEILVVGGTHESLNLLNKITDSKKVEALGSKDFLPLLSIFHKKSASKEDFQTVSQEDSQDA